MPVKKQIFDEKLGAKDHLVEWQKPKRKPVWMSVEAYADLPDTITIREFNVGGANYASKPQDHPRAVLRS